MFALPQPRLREMGEAGRERVAHITWDAVVDARRAERVRLALWTPRPARGWLSGVVPELERAARLVVVADEPRPRPQVDLHVYHVANDPAYGFVYRALLGEPGLVVLEDWKLHELVLAETAGRGDLAAYRREMRRAHGPTGAFVARQVLRGLGGELTSLLALNERVLEASLALVVKQAGDLPRAAARAAGRPLVHLPLDARDAARAAGALVALAREALPRLPGRSSPPAFDRRRRRRRSGGRSARSVPSRASWAWTSCPRVGRARRRPAAGPARGGRELRRSPRPAGIAPAADGAAGAT